MTSMKHLCPGNNHAMLERALVLEPDRAEFAFLFLHCKLCSVANVTLLSELSAMTRLDECGNPRKEILVFLLLVWKP